MLEVLLRVVHITTSKVGIPQANVHIQRATTRDRLCVLINRFLLIPGNLIVQLLELSVFIRCTIRLATQRVTLGSRRGQPFVGEVTQSDDQLDVVRICLCNLIKRLLRPIEVLQRQVGRGELGHNAHIARTQIKSGLVLLCRTLVVTAFHCHVSRTDVGGNIGCILADRLLESLICTQCITTFSEKLSIEIDRCSAIRGEGEDPLQEILIGISVLKSL